MKKLIYILPLLFTLMFLVSSCESTTDPDPVSNGTLSITSNPTGAMVYEGAALKGTTPDTISLSSGSHTITVKMNGYRDTTFSVNITANVTLKKHVDLSSTLSVSQYGFTTPIQIWESDDPSATHPSGVQLSTGIAVAVGSSSANRLLADFVYSSSNNWNFITASDFSNLTRVTWFKPGTGSSMTDTASAPAFDAATWVKQIPDNQSNYFFVYNNDQHYAKVKVVERHVASGPGDYSWVRLQWIYNRTAGDRRFK